MTTKEQVEIALHRIAARVKDPGTQARLKGFKRDVIITFPDLQASYLFRVHEASVEPTIVQTGDKGHVEVITKSETFLGILNGTVDGFSAFASGKLKVHGPISDLLKLQEILRQF